MNIEASIALQLFLLVLAFIVSFLRCWVRVRITGRSLTAADYLVWCGWLCCLGWVICSIKALHLQLTHPLQGEQLETNSVDYLTTVFVAQFFFDIGIFFPKAALCAFYVWLVPRGLKNVRIGLYCCIAYLGAAFITTLLTDVLIAPHISDNWNIERQLLSTWNSYPAFVVAWTMNFSTDLILFVFPFFLIGGLKLHRRQKIGLIGVFSLGLITTSICLSRFVAYTVTDFNLDDGSGNLISATEMCTAVIVVSLPTLKPLIVRSSPNSTSVPSHHTGYIQHLSSKVLSHKGVHSPAAQSDDEMELFGADQPVMTRSYAGSQKAGVEPGKEREVLVTTDVVITRM